MTGYSRNFLFRIGLTNWVSKWYQQTNELGLTIIFLCTLLLDRFSADWPDEDRVGPVLALGTVEVDDVLLKQRSQK